jgi:hypothetical protein
VEKGLELFEKWKAGHEYLKMKKAKHSQSPIDFQTNK